MIKNWKLFNDAYFYEGINLGDRVACYGERIVWLDEGKKTIDLSGQTGIVDGREYGYVNVVFDNKFLPQMDEFDNDIKVDRCLCIRPANVVKMDMDKRNKCQVHFSKDSEKIVEYVEYIKFPIYAAISYIDITDKSDFISYLSFDRIHRLPKEEDPWTSPLRQEMKVGRFIQLINPFTDRMDLEMKINMYKSAYNALIVKNTTTEIVSGEDIRYWYDERRYAPGNGPLNKSCMRARLDKLDLYCENPDKISLLIMKNDENQLVGRALIWNIDEPEITYMDRIYTIYPEGKFDFLNIAKENGWRTYNQPILDMSVKLKRNYGKGYQAPYMDTLKYFDPSDNTLNSNNRKLRDYYLYDEV